MDAAELLLELLWLTASVTAAALLLAEALRAAELLALPGCQRAASPPCHLRRRRRRCHRPLLLYRRRSIHRRPRPRHECRCSHCLHEEPAAATAATGDNSFWQGLLPRGPGRATATRSRRAAAACGICRRLRHRHHSTGTVAGLQRIYLPLDPDRVWPRRSATVSSVPPLALGVSLCVRLVFGYVSLVARDQCRRRQVCFSFRSGGSPKDALWSGWISTLDCEQ